MANYLGKTNQEAYTTNNLGINAKASPLNLQPGEASDILNWDIDLSGAITRRLGFELEHSDANAVVLIDSFYKLDGTHVYVYVNGAGTLFEATDPSGPWTDRGTKFGTVGYGANWIGASVNGQYVLCNGVDKPVVFIPGQNARTLEDASLLDPPNNLSCLTVGGASSSYRYVMTSVTPRGESTVSDECIAYYGPTTFDSTHYVIINWVPRLGATAQKLYRFNTATGMFDLLATLGGSAATYTDNGAALDATSHPPAVNGAYNTPADWNTNGQPEGVFLVAKGKNQRLMAWRKQAYFFSALSNVYDWYSPNDAFARSNLGGSDNNITAVTSLFDYTLLFSRTNTFAYTGSSDTDWSLSRVFNTGCPSHKSIVFVGEEGILWTQFGPATIQRILQGADIKSTSVGQKITPIVYNDTNKDKWNKICAWEDVLTQRVCFAIPGVGKDQNSFVLAFNYQTKGWTRFDFSGWSILSTTYDPNMKMNHAAMSLSGASPIIGKIHSSNSDLGGAIANSYTTPFMDARTERKKRDLFVDVMMDGQNPYSVTFDTYLDYDTSALVETHTLTFDGTSAKTDGQCICDQGTLVNTHRVSLSGVGDSIRLVFKETETGTTPAKILGWRPDWRMKGIR